MSDIKTTKVLTNQVVEVEKSELLHILLTATAAGAADIEIRDGHNTGGDSILVIKAAANESFQYTPCHPIPFEKGIFVQIGSNVQSCIVQTRKRS